jgi:hypothetical protein
MGIARLLDRTICPIAVWVPTFLASTTSSSTTWAVPVIGLPSAGLASARSVSFCGSCSRMRLAGLFSHSVPPLDLIWSDELTFGLFFQILSADFDVCLPLVMLASDGQIVLTREFNRPYARCVCSVGGYQVDAWRIEKTEVYDWIANVWSRVPKNFPSTGAVTRYILAKACAVAEILFCFFVRQCELGTFAGILSKDI